MSGARIAMFWPRVSSARYEDIAAYLRGILRALHAYDFDITLYEAETDRRRASPRIEDWARVVSYSPDKEGWQRVLEQAKRADIVIKTSGAGADDRELDIEIAHLRAPHRTTLFWDVDVRATLERARGGVRDPLREALRGYDVVLSYGGGESVVKAYAQLGARHCIPIYNALDPRTHFPAPPQPRFAGELAYLRDRGGDAARVREFFLSAARALPDHRFVFAGESVERDVDWPANVRCVAGVAMSEHNSFYCSSRAILNLQCGAGASAGCAPPGSLFAAAGASACIVCDYFEGIEYFLEPGREVLTVQQGAEVASVLAAMDERRAKAIGRAARERILNEHTYFHRAAFLCALLGRSRAPLRIAV